LPVRFGLVSIGRGGFRRHPVVAAQANIRPYLCVELLHGGERLLWQSDLELLQRHYTAEEASENPGVKSAYPLEIPHHTQLAICILSDPVRSFEDVLIECG
jgi:hypothetical protein